MDYIALQGTDIVSVLVDWVLPSLVIVFLVAVLMWVLAYTSRFFEYLKMQESKWFSRDTLDFARRFLSLIWVVLFVVGALAVLQFRFDIARSVLSAVIAHVPAAFFVLFVLFIAIVFVKVQGNFAAYLRGELRIKPKTPAPPRSLAATEFVLKWAIYLIAGIGAFIGGVQALPDSDRPVKDAVSALIATERWTSGLVIVAGAILAAFVGDRVVDSVFDDLKKRTQKLNAKVMDQVKLGVRAGLFLVVGIVALFLLLNLVLEPVRLLVVAVGFIALMVVATFAAGEALQEGIAGLALMMSDPFDVGDRVKIGDDLVCDVVGTYLTMTQVRTLKGELVTIPNSRLRSEPVLNFSRSQAVAMFIDVAVPFAVPHSRVREVLLEAARRTAGIVENPPPEVFGKDVSGGSLEYQLLAYTRDLERMKQVKSDLVFNLQDALQRFGVLPAVTER